jgi:glutathione S-transferase
MLEIKGIDHDVVELLPGMHPVQLRAAGFRGGTVPALKSDGKRVQGSLRISRFLEQLEPDPPLFPGEPDRRAAVEEAEAWGEAKLQPIARRIFRWGTVHSRELRRWLGEVSGIPLPGAAATVNAPVARYFARLSDANDDGVRADLATLPATLDRVDGLITDATIGGEVVNAADCQIASTVRMLLAYEDLRRILEDRPSAELAARLFPDYPGPIPLRLPGPWLPGRLSPPSTMARRVGGLEEVPHVHTQATPSCLACGRRSARAPAPRRRLRDRLAHGAEHR